VGGGPEREKESGQKVRTWKIRVLNWDAGGVGEGDRNRKTQCNCKQKGNDRYEKGRGLILHTRNICSLRRNGRKGQTEWEKEGQKKTNKLWPGLNVG